MQALAAYRSTTANSANAAALWAEGAPALPPQPAVYADGAAPLHLRVLRNARERQVIAGLRRLSAFGVEQDLGLELKPLEQKRDEVAIVTAVYRQAKLLATLRFVPTGHRLTGAERLADKVEFDTSILGEGSYEVGRVVMAPEDRHPDLLAQCLAVTLQELMQMEDVRHFHATTTLAMARLWRRVGMRTVFTTTGASGTRYCLVHGRVEDVARALNLPQVSAEQPMLLMPELLAAQAAAQQSAARA